MEKRPSDPDTKWKCSRCGEPVKFKAKSSTERGDKRKSDMQAAAILNGFENWSAMMTYIKNQALAGRAVINK